MKYREDELENYLNGKAKSIAPKRIKRNSKKKLIAKILIVLGIATVVVASNVPNVLQEGRNCIIENINEESNIPELLKGKTNIEEIVYTAFQEGQKEGYSSAEITDYLRVYNISDKAIEKVSSDLSSKGCQIKPATGLEISIEEYKAYFNQIKTNSRGGR